MGGILDSLPLLVVQIGVDRRYRYVNKAMADWYQKRPDQIIGQRVEEVLPPEVHRRLRPYIDAALEGERRTFAEALTYPDGRVRQVRGEFIPQFDAEGQVTDFVVFSEDDTGRREAEIALRESESRYRQAERLAKLGHWRLDAAPSGNWLDARVDFMNSAAAQLGRTAGEASTSLAQSIERNVHPDDRQAYLAECAHIYETQQCAYSMKYRMVRADGEVIHVVEAGENTYDAEGRLTHSFGITQDVTAQKRVEDELRRQEALHRQAASIAKLGYWRMTAAPSGRWQDAVVYFSEPNAALFSLKPVEMSMTLGQSIERHLHPEDRQAYTDACDRVYRTGVREASFEYRVVREDGSITHVVEIGENIFDDQGRFLHAFGITQDVTERKNIENELRRSEAALEHAHRIAHLCHWLWTAGPDGGWGGGRTKYSASASDIFGVPVEELALSNREFVERFVHADDRAVTARSFASVERGEPGYVAEYRIVRPDGAIRVVHETAETSYGRDGRVVGNTGTLQDITELRRAEQALHESESLFRQAARMAKLGHWRMTAAPSGRWQDTTLLLSELTTAHFTASARESSITLGESIARHIHPDDQAAYTEASGRIYTTGVTEYILEYRSLREDGSIAEIVEIGENFFDADGRFLYGFGTTQDVTEQRQVEKRLRLSETRLAGLFQIAPEAIIVADAQSRITMFSAGAEDIFGYAAAEVLGQSVEMLLPEAARGNHAQHVARFAGAPEASRKMAQRSEIAGRRKNGAIFPAEASISKFRSGEEMIFTVILHDITERQKAENELMMAKQQAEFANRAKSQFLANMSHELRTPLNAIIGFSDIMQRELMGPVGTPTYREYSTDIHASGLHLLNIINDLLDITRIEIGKVALSEQAVAPAALIETCLRMTRGRAEEGGLRLQTEVPAGLPQIMGDERLLKQILLNLLSNAIKFTPEGGKVTLSTATTADGGLDFMVKDTGIGMSAEEIEPAFRAFVQIDNRLARKYQGTGLGLSISRALAELHGGTLAILSEPGRGTTVTLHLPAARMIAAQPPDAARG